MDYSVSSYDSYEIEWDEQLDNRSAWPPWDFEMATRDLIDTGSGADTSPRKPSSYPLDFDLESGSGLLFTPKAALDPGELREPEIDPDDVDVPLPKKRPSKKAIPITPSKIGVKLDPAPLKFLSGDQADQLDLETVGYFEIAKKGKTSDGTSSTQPLGTDLPLSRPDFSDPKPPADFEIAMLKAYDLWNPNGAFSAYATLRAAMLTSSPKTLDKRVKDAVNLLTPRLVPAKLPIRPLIDGVTNGFVARKPVIRSLPVLRNVPKAVQSKDSTIAGTISLSSTKSPDGPVQKKQKLEEVMTKKKPNVIIVRPPVQKAVTIVEPKSPDSALSEPTSFAVVDSVKPPAATPCPEVTVAPSSGLATYLEALRNGERIVICSRNSLPLVRKPKSIKKKKKKAPAKPKTTMADRKSKKAASGANVSVKSVPYPVAAGSKPGTLPTGIHPMGSKTSRTVVVRSRPYQEPRPQYVVVQPMAQSKPRKKSKWVPNPFSERAWAQMAMASRS